MERRWEHAIKVWEFELFLQILLQLIRRRKILILILASVVLDVTS